MPAGRRYRVPYAMDPGGASTAGVFAFEAGNAGVLLFHVFFGLALRAFALFRMARCLPLLTALAFIPRPTVIHLTAP